jgi:hypothetical protein
MERELLVFDMETREYKNKISFPNELSPFDRNPDILEFYGDPLQLLALVFVDDSDIRHYCFFDTGTKTSKLFSMPGNVPNDIIILKNYKILATNTAGLHNTGIFLFDAINNSNTTIIDNIPHTIHGLKELGNGKLGFIISVHDPRSFPNFGSKILRLFCLWDEYVEEEEGMKWNSMGGE